MRYALTLCAVMLSGCSSLLFNDGERVSIRHPAGYPHATVDGEASAECVKAGKKRAVRVNTSDQTAYMPSVIDNNVATFRCE